MRSTIVDEVFLFGGNSSFWLYVANYAGMSKINGSIHFFIGR
jgi:hypothetical protein